MSPQPLLSLANSPKSDERDSAAASSTEPKFRPLLDHRPVIGRIELLNRCRDCDCRARRATGVIAMTASGKTGDGSRGQDRQEEDHLFVGKLGSSADGAFVSSFSSLYLRRVPEAKSRCIIRATAKTLAVHRLRRDRRWNRNLDRVGLCPGCLATGHVDAIHGDFQLSMVYLNK